MRFRAGEAAARIASGAITSEALGRRLRDWSGRQLRRLQLQDKPRRADLQKSGKAGKLFWGTLLLSLPYDRDALPTRTPAACDSTLNVQAHSLIGSRGSMGQR